MKSLNKKYHSYDDVISFFKPIEYFMLGAYKSLNELIFDGINYYGNGQVPAKIIFKQYCPFATMHEMAHIIEWTMSGKKRRLGLSGFGFRYSLDGLGYDSPRTCKAFEREIRTIAICFFVLNHHSKELGLTKYQILHQMLYDIDSICSFMNDSFLFYNDSDKMGIDVSNLYYDEKKKLVKKQVFKRVLLEMGNLSMDEIIKYKLQADKYFNRKRKNKTLKVINHSGSVYDSLSD